MKPKKKKLRSLLGELPPEILEPQMRLVGRQEAVVEKCSEVLIYTGELVKLRVGKYCLQITGEQLSLKALSADSLVVCGCFAQIEFLEG